MSTNTYQSLDQRFQVLRSTIAVANEVVEFDEHLVYAPAYQAFPEALWHLEEGPKLPASKQHSKFLREYRRFVTLSAPKQLQFTLNDFPTTFFRVGENSETIAIAKLVRRRSQPFSTTDNRLLRALSNLVADAIRNPGKLSMLDRLLVFLLDGRIYLQGSRTSQEVLDVYLGKLEGLCHPDVYQGKATPETVFANAKLINSNSMALHMRAFRPSGARVWTKAIKATRYATKGSSSFASRVFESGESVITGRYNRDSPRQYRLLPGIRSHISAPILAGDMEGAIGIFTIESTNRDAYTQAHGNGATLLAAHAARPLRRAIALDIANKRSRERNLAAEATASLMRCKSWSAIQSQLEQTLKSMGYTRGLFCRVDHDAGIVKGAGSWGDGFTKLSRDTMRHFDRDRNDCQVIVARTGKPFVVSDPSFNSAVNRNAIRVGSLHPFVVLPFKFSDETTPWTLHVEREDFAPFSQPDEVQYLMQLCADAVKAQEYLEQRRRQAAQLHLDKLTIAWSHNVYHIIRPATLFTTLAKFLSTHLSGVSCTVLQKFSRSWQFIYRVPHQSGPEDTLRHGRVFQLPSKSTALFLKTSEQAIVVRGPHSKAIHSVKGFKVIRQQTLRGLKHLGLPSSGEWVEVPIFDRGRLAAAIVIVRNDAGWRTEELKFISDLGLITSHALSRLVLEDQLERELLYAMSMAAFRHEVDHSIVRIRDVAAHLRGTGAKRLAELTQAEINHIGLLQAFFRSEVLDVDQALPRVESISNEMKCAVGLLADHRWSVKFPRNVSAVVAGQRHPLCLILLQLLTNALDAAEKASTKPSIFMKYERLSDLKTHRITLEDHGKGFNKRDFRWLSRPQADLEIPHWRPTSRPTGTGLGLVYARLIAYRYGWTIRLDSAKSPTRWVLDIPVSLH